MDRSAAMALVGRKVRIYNQSGQPTNAIYLLARFDVTRRQFTARNIHTSKDSPLTVDDLTRALAENMLRVEHAS